jgi:tight adherence protein C
MIDVALGAVAGLGLFLIVSRSVESRLASRLIPHLADVAPLRESGSDVDGVFRALVAVTRLPLRFWGPRRKTGQRAISEELPEVIDLIGLCVASGFTVPAAFERVSRSGRGALASECRTVVAEISVGVSVSDALRLSDRRVGHPGWTRLVEHLVAARRQGTPLNDILRSLAEDEQESSTRRLLESASARETLMMFPLVFVILPVTVVMAVFPGLTALGSISL